MCIPYLPSKASWNLSPSNDDELRSLGHNTLLHTLLPSLRLPSPLHRFDLCSPPPNSSSPTAATAKYAWPESKTLKLQSHYYEYISLLGSPITVRTRSYPARMTEPGLRDLSTLHAKIQRNSLGHAGLARCQGEANFHPVLSPPNRPRAMKSTSHETLGTLHYCV